MLKVLIVFSAWLTHSQTVIVLHSASKTHYTLYWLLTASNVSEAAAMSDKTSKKAVTKIFPFFLHFCISFFCVSGDVYEEKVRLDEESVWVECIVRLRDSIDYLQQCQQTIPVCQHRHGQSSPQVHGVQWASWKQNKQRHHWCKSLLESFLAHTR